MGKSLFELRAELAREKSLTQSKKEVENMGTERARLQKEIKQERFNRQYGGYISKAKKVGGAIGGAMSSMAEAANNSKKKGRGRSRPNARPSFNPWGW